MDLSSGKDVTRTPESKTGHAACTKNASVVTQGSEEVDDETAAMVARSLHLVQGPHGVPTSVAQCRFLTVDLLTGICLVSSPSVSAPLSPVSRATVL